MARFDLAQRRKPAVSVVVNVEEDAEQQALDGDPVSERIGGVLSIVPEGRPDPGLAQIFACRLRAGAWPGRCAAFGSQRRSLLAAAPPNASRQSLRMLAEDGHETACHGWLWRPHADYDSAEVEAADLDRAAEAILRTTGERPRGFFCHGAESLWTRGLLAERGYLYISNGFDDDLPYRDASGLIVVPYGLDTNDMKFSTPMALSGPRT